jgi:biotin transport system substrate-specific component
MVYSSLGVHIRVRCRDIGDLMPESIARGHSAALELTTSGLLAALLAASAVVAVPIGAVPLTLQTLVLVLVALTQRPKRAALSVGVYLAAGLVGLPVFSGMRGGFAVILGPTGGFLLGFLAGAVAGAWVRTRLEVSVAWRVVSDVAAALTVIAVVYVFGWLQLTLVTSMGAVPALLAGVVPFLAPDVLKAAGAIALAPLVREAMGSRP